MATVQAHTHRPDRDVTVTPVRRLQGVYRPPADKSIAHRALILSAIASGQSSVSPITRAVDVNSTAACLRQLGVDIREHQGAWAIHSPGIDHWLAPERALDCGNSGTTMRLLAGCLASCGFKSKLIGDDSLSQRPMSRIADPLKRMGAQVVLSENNTAPVYITGTALSGITYELPVPSAQVKSALLLAGLKAIGPMAVIEQSATRDHTERLLQYCGVDCETDVPHRPTGDRRELLLSGETDEVPTPRRTVRLGEKRTVKPTDWQIPGDFSAAAFVIAAAVGMRRADVIIEDVGINPTRTGIIKVLKRMGVECEVKRQGESCGEPFGQIRVEAAGQLKAVKVSEREVPTLIDELPILAVLAARAEGVTVIRGAGELRKKESDRISAVCSNLRLMGGKVAELEDGWAIEGPTEWRGAPIDSAGDHRIAMAFAVAALWADGPSTISNAGVMAISDPDFLSSLIALTQ